MDGKMFSTSILLFILSTTTIRAVDAKVLSGCDSYAKCLRRLNAYAEAKSICQMFTGVEDGQCDRKVHKPKKTFHQKFVRFYFFRIAHCQNGLNGHEHVTSSNRLKMVDNNVLKNKVKLRTVMIKHAVCIISVFRFYFIFILFR